MPNALIVAGPNGAGKSTFAREYLRGRDVPFPGADAIAERINPERPEDVAVQAGRQFLRALEDPITHGEEFVVESTLAGQGPLRRLAFLRGNVYSECAD